MKIKAIFLDMDETLCDTSGANNKALEALQVKCLSTFGDSFDAQRFTQDYLSGIYREDSLSLVAELYPKATSESEYRLMLIEALIGQQGIVVNNFPNIGQTLQDYFDETRMQLFDFFPGTTDMLTRLRKNYKLTVITNGPTFSQYPKLKSVDMEKWVDHILVGGDLVENGKKEKPHPEIFELALAEAGCLPSEAIHVGDSLKADIYGANQMGILNVWINPYHPQEKHFEEGHQPFYTIPKITDLEQILELCQ